MDTAIDEELSISENLDEEGFPLSVSSDDSHQEKEAESSVENVQGSFAMDFYRSGTDWSCLLQKRSVTERNLVQQSLFQVWGFKKTEGLDSRVSMKKRGMQDVKSEFKRKKIHSLGVGNDESSSNKSSCPFYKKIPGTPFVVDAFGHGLIEGCKGYFLSHFHSDHYGGLNRKWTHGPIYCTPLTARLVKMLLSVNPLFIHPLDLDTEYGIEGTKVTLIEANHCPGAALVHFRLVDGRCYVHTGDFRACKLMQSHPLLLNQHVNLLFLDTTYCDPKYRFPSKEDVVDFVVKTVQESLTRQPKTLIIVGAYSIGKEQVYMSISKALGVKIYANASRRRILQSFDWPQMSGNLCLSGQSTPLHVIPISSLRHENLKRYLKDYEPQFKEVLAFRPTGWTYSEKVGNQLDLIKPISSGNIRIYGVPYSEHSSFSELKEFVQFLRPDKIIPTVNIGNATNRAKMQSYFREWLKN